MANPLTGEHDAVLQVSVGTLNRLLASMHQNDLIDDTVLPTIPHSAFVRVGDDPATRVDGVQGEARVQSGVPQLELLHMAQDRVAIHVWLRARFTPSSGAAPFREFIHGTLRAEYVLKEIAGADPGPGALLFNPPRFRFDVDASRVKFTSADDTSQDPAITRQIVALLKMTFEMPVGQPTFTHFLDRKLISLSVGGSQAVAVGLELGPGVSATERPRQIANIVTGGKDFAVAASREYILSLLRPQLDALLATTTNVHVQWLFVGVDYTVRVTSAKVSWALDTIASGGTFVPCAALDLTIEGKGETTSIAPDGTFTIKHRTLLSWNAAARRLFLVPKGGPSVSVHFAGIGLIESAIEDEVESQFTARIAGALAAAVPHLAVPSQFGDFLAEQLKLSDANAKAIVDAAEFTTDGVILRGTVSLSSRTRPVVYFDPLPDKTGYGAFLSWFPGGRITALSWLWQPDPESTVTAEQAFTDRFVVQPAIPMPGLPPPTGGAIGGGRVCLRLAGLVIDPVTGAEVSSFAGVCISVDVEPPAFFADVTPARLRWQLGAGAVVEAGHGDAGAGRCNTLLYHVGGAMQPSSLSAVVDGIGSGGRDDAGLLVLAVVPEGGLDQPAAARLREAEPPGDTVVRIVEDTSAEWARAFRVSESESLRLVAPNGRLVWSHDGEVDAATVSAALREHLVASPLPRFLPLRPEAATGRPAPLAYLDPVRGERISLAHLRGRPVTLCFALSGAESSLEEVRRLRTETDRAPGFAAVVLTDADADAASALAGTPPNLVVVPDPYRSITGLFGVYLWPTTITIDEVGVVTSVTAGLHPSYEPEIPA